MAFISRGNGRFGMGLIFLFLFLCPTPSGAQSVPGLINYQGRLSADDGTPVSGPRQMYFAIYDSPSSPTPLWGETQTVTMSGGLYHVLLGSVHSIPPSLFSGPERYLEVKVEGEVLGPRTAFASVPYALACDLNSLLTNQDLDEDGHASALFGGDDCNDADPQTYLDAPEITGDGMDQSCDGYPLGPRDVCLLCGVPQDRSLDGCAAEIEGDYIIGYSGFESMRDCMETGGCSSFQTCFDVMRAGLEDDLCSYLDSCGYIDYSDCLLDVAVNWDGDRMAVLTAPTVCLLETASCDPAAIRECLTTEALDYNRMVDSQSNFALDFHLIVPFSDPAQSFQVKNPRGVISPLVHDGGWNWSISTVFEPLSPFGRDWPAGTYQILSGATVYDAFNVPPYDVSMYPKTFFGVTPAHLSAVDVNPLPVSWQLNTGAEPMSVFLQNKNFVRGTNFESDDIAPDVFKCSLQVPPNTLTGDTLTVLFSTKVASSYANLDDLKQVFLRQFCSHNWAEYTWTGPDL